MSLADASIDKVIQLLSERKQKKNVIVGLDSCLDAVYHLRSIKDLDELLDIHDVYKVAKEYLSKGLGGELPMEERSIVETAMRRLDESGIESFYNLGGNGAIQSTSLAKMGKEHVSVQFYGVWFSKVLETLKTRNADAWREISEITKLLPPDDVNFPVSLILELGKERFIVAHGQGRRINDISKIVAKLKDFRADIYSIGGIHAILATAANAPHDPGVSFFFREIHAALEKLRERSHLVIDCGSFSPYSEEMLRKMFENIFSRSEILSLNEIELLELCNAIGIPLPQSVDFDLKSEMSAKLLDFGDMDAVWVHGADYSLSVRKKSYHSLIIPMYIASAAGAWRVYTSRPPSLDEIIHVLKHWKPKKAPPPICNFHGYTVETVPSFEPPQIKATVGAGDTAAAGFVLGLSLIVEGAK